MLARTFTIDQVARADLIDRFQDKVPEPVQRLLASIIVEMRDDCEVLQTCLFMLSNEQQQLQHLDQMVEDLVTDRVLIEGSVSTYEILPTAATLLRKQLFDMIVYDRQRDSVAHRLLCRIDKLRDEHGRPDDEPRHPMLESGVPWPMLDRSFEAKPS